MQEIDQIAVARRLASLPATRHRIAPLEIDGVRTWLKDFDQPSPAEWHRVQRVLFAVTRLQVLRPVPSLYGVQGATNEIVAMSRFRQNDARVPEVLWTDGARILLSDIGQTMRDLHHRLGASSIDAAIKTAARELNRLHTQGIVHGRPILRNMTWDGRTVGFLDFEERPRDVMPLATAKARDLLLFLMSVARRCEEELLPNTFVVYAANIPPNVEIELQRVVRVSGPLIRALGRGFVKSRNRNMRGLTGALTAVRQGLALHRIPN